MWKYEIIPIMYDNKNAKIEPNAVIQGGPSKFLNFVNTTCWCKIFDKYDVWWGDPCLMHYRIWNIVKT